MNVQWRKNQFTNETSTNSLESIPILTTNNACPRKRFLTAKKRLKIVFWNVRTMSQLSKTEQVIKQMIQYKIDILAFWSTMDGYGPKKDHTIIYSGNDASRGQGVALLLTVPAKVMISWTPILIILHTFCQEVLRKYGIWERNDNGELLIDFSLLHDLVIGRSIFLHPDIHKYSWTPPDCRIRNQIDHCLINRKWLSSLQDVRAYRGAYVGSDYNLMIATILLKLKKHTRKCPLPAKPLFASAKLKDKKLNTLFNIKLSNKFETIFLPEDAHCDTI